MAWPYRCGGGEGQRQPVRRAIVITTSDYHTGICTRSGDESRLLVPVLDPVFGTGPLPPAPLKTWKANLQRPLAKVSSRPTGPRAQP
eukprot:scaffold121412_cov34-Prasinocladus_malaysianus.AAC.1